MMTSHNSKPDQPVLDLHTRPMRTRWHFGRWVWIAIAVVFNVFVIVSVAVRAMFIG